MRSGHFRWAVIVAGASLLAAPAHAQQAAGSRCEGTICDLFYGGSAAPAPAPAAPPPGSRPLTVPSSGGGILSMLAGGGGQPQSPNGSVPAQQATAAPGEGGLIAMMKGQSSSRCTGTLCDFYYGGSAPEHPEAAISGAAVAGGDAAGAVAPAIDDRPRRPEAKRCVAPANDPWRCYRH